MLDKKRDALENASVYYNLTVKHLKLLGYKYAVGFDFQSCSRFIMREHLWVCFTTNCVDIQSVLVFL